MASLDQIFLILAGGLIAFVIVILGGMIAFGSENPPPKLASMNDPFEKVDFSDLPPLETVSARRGSPKPFAAGSRPATLALPSSRSMDQQGPSVGRNQGLCWIESSNSRNSCPCKRSKKGTRYLVQR